MPCRAPDGTVESRDVGRYGRAASAESRGVRVALNDAGTLRRYMPKGVVNAVIEVPARKVTACTFGGQRLDELFITTSREDLMSTRWPARCSGRQSG